MGSKCSQHTSTDQCHCFADDTKIKAVDIVRYSRGTWIWSVSHDLALINSLSDFHDLIPKEIMILIKEHSYHKHEEFVIMRPILCHEKYYCKNNQLLRKHLCKSWYQQTEFTEHSFTIALHASNYRNSTQILNALNTESLPALQFRYDKYEDIRRTMYIDDCQIRLHVMAVRQNEIDNETIKHSMINIIVLNEYEPLLQTNNTCQIIWEQKKSMKNCVIVWLQNCIKTYKNSASTSVATMKQLARYYNIPFLSLSLNTDKATTDLFSFAVKYYWFCNVVQ